MSVSSEDVFSLWVCVSLGKGYARSPEVSRVDAYPITLLTHYSNKRSERLSTHKPHINFLILTNMQAELLLGLSIEFQRWSLAVMHDPACSMQLERISHLKHAGSLTHGWVKY